MNSQIPIHHLRTLQPAELQALHQSPDGMLHLQTLSPGLQNLDAIAADASDALFQQRYHLGAPPQAPHGLHAQNSYDPNAGLSHAQTQFQPMAAGYLDVANRFNLISTPPQHLHAPPPPAIPRARQQIVELEPQTDYGQIQDVDDTPVTSHGQFEGLKLIPHPPDLDEWRDKLFHVDDAVTLTEDEFQTYFPHIDNVYSHRSTQRHKRKRFVSHYWDCRLKGRPPGTKKSTDPDKKKRKRVARERDLCDVKIKITEYFDGADLTEQTGQQPPTDTMDGNLFFAQQPQVNAQPQVNVNAWGVPTIGGNMPMNQPPTASKKLYMIQRINGNGGNGKGDGIAGPHKHTLEESDKVKKNSVSRWMLKSERDKKRVQGGDVQKKTYHKKATGNALTTVKSHAKEDELKLYGSCFCPFVQRVWISLEHKKLAYQYIEVDPYKKPASLLAVNPRGLVPALRHGPTWSTHESTVIIEYLEDLAAGPALLPRDAQTRATCRLWSDHVNRSMIPCFYRLLQAQDANDQVSHATELRDQISKLVDAADAQGPFFLGSTFGFVDVQMAPWVLRLRRVLAPYRGWPDPEAGSRWERWVSAIENEPSVQMTTSDDGLYLDSYERYAENRPDTSQLANAVNSGRGLP